MSDGATQLLPAVVRNTLPPLYSQEEVEDPIVKVKIFCPWNNWTWFITEGHDTGDDFLMFGWVVGLEREWGYISLTELESVTCSKLGGIGLERDLYFKPAPISEVMSYYDRLDDENTRSNFKAFRE